MKHLTDLPNISEVIAEKLMKAGISNPDDLTFTGSKQAFFRIRVLESDCCINMLYALEGAVQGIRWHSLDEKTKNDLKLFYNSISYFKQVK